MLPVLFDKLAPAVRADFEDGMNRLFDELFNDDFFKISKNQGLTPSGGGYPKCDVTSFDDRIEIIAEIPFLTKEDISVETCYGMLTIKGNKRQETEEKKGGKVVLKELKRSSFQRSFMLDNDLDENGITADLKDGLLTVVVKKRVPPPSPVKKVEIK